MIETLLMMAMMMMTRKVLMTITKLWGRNFFTAASKLALGPIQLHIQCAQGLFPRG
jgi:hypothetical protein